MGENYGRIFWYQSAVNETFIRILCSKVIFGAHIQERNWIISKMAWVDCPVLNSNTLKKWRQHQNHGLKIIRKQIFNPSIEVIISILWAE